MPKSRRVVFAFDERSYENIEKLAAQGRAASVIKYDMIPVHDPETGETRNLMVPRFTEADRVAARGLAHAFRFAEESQRHAETP